MKLKVSAVHSSQPPQTRKAIRAESVRAWRRVAQRPNTSRISAAGISQAICPPMSPSNSRVRPVEPHLPPPFIGLPPPPARPPPPTLPVSLPVIRPKPL